MSFFPIQAGKVFCYNVRYVMILRDKNKQQAFKCYQESRISSEMLYSATAVFILHSSYNNRGNASM